MSRAFSDLDSLDVWNDHRLAFDVGGERDPGKETRKIRPAHWDGLAVQCDIRKQFLRLLVEESVSAISEQIPAVKETFEKRFGAYPALQRVETVIRKQCRRAIQS